MALERRGSIVIDVHEFDEFLVRFIVRPASRVLVSPAPPTLPLISTYLPYLPSAHCEFMHAERETLLLTMFASTAPPRKTMCRRLGGSSMRTLNFYRLLVYTGQGVSAYVRSDALDFLPVS
jgi:hypothetical protein